LRETLERKEKERDALISQEQAILQATDRQALQPFAAAFSSQAKEKERKETMPYHEHTFGGFRILVGKNAAANDQLTLHHTYKEDLWLHAKDVAGSHVVIKHQSGKSFPKDVIEYAAALAAFHSKRKNESLCPVAVTPAKYVRKRKGDLPGAVVVQREDVMMVVPDSGKRM
jgi:predicted ribosome quality control (RQC) complex YloA/Tae2 family protein